MMPTVLTACSLVWPVSKVAHALTLTAATRIGSRRAPWRLWRMVLLPYLEVERIRRAHADRGLVCRTALDHERAVRGVAEQPGIFDIGTNFPLRIDPVGRLGAGADRVGAPPRIEG